MVAPVDSESVSISVIIPTFNRSKFLPKALESVFNQTYQIEEVIVVDDGSTDGSLNNLSQQFPSAKFFFQENQGVSAARNHGIRKAKGRWIALLDSDDQWLPDKIEKQIDFLRDNEIFQACYTEECWIRKGNQVKLPASLEKSNHKLFSRSLERCVICPSSLLIKRTLFKKVGFFDENLPICEDYDFWIRLLLNHKIGLIKEPLVKKFGGHSDQLSTSTWGLDRYHVQSLEKILNFKQLDLTQELQILKTLNKKCDFLEKGFLKHGKNSDAQNYRTKKNNAQKRLDKLKLN